MAARRSVDANASSKSPPANCWTATLIMSVTGGQYELTTHPSLDDASHKPRSAMMSITPYKRGPKLVPAGFAPTFARPTSSRVPIVLINEFSGADFKEPADR